MALIGNTTIQLFDAKTGELTDEVKKSNLVTNAVNNVLNGALNAVAVGINNGLGKHQSINYLYNLPSGYNIAKALFGGVLIFSNSIQADVDHCIPTIDEMRSFIGCANQHASIDGSEFKGSLNEGESEVGDNYVKFVWDFTTGQCNGDIASICLTSDCGGSLGYKFNSLTDVKQNQSLKYISSGIFDYNTASDYNPAYIHNPMFKSSFTESNAHGHYIDGNFLYYVFRNKIYKYNIGRLLNKIGSSITESFDYGAASNYDELINTSSYETGILKCLDSDKVYEYNTNTSGGFRIVKISRNAETEVINVPTDNILASINEYLNNNAIRFNTSYPKWSVVHKDKIYVLVGWVNNKNLNVKPNKLRMYVLSFDGSFTYKDINITDNFISMLFGTKTYSGAAADPGIGYTKIFDNLCIISADSTNGYKCFLVSDDGNIDEYPFLASGSSSLENYGYDLYKNSNWLKEPWCSFKLCENGIVNSIELWMAYLATINNQDVVLTKTADKTMKIIYTLTQE